TTDSQHFPPFPTRRSSDLEERAKDAKGAAGDQCDPELLQAEDARPEDGRREAAGAAGGAIGQDAGSDEARGRLLRLQLLPLRVRSEEHTSELQSPCNLVCR